MRNTVVEAVMNIWWVPALRAASGLLVAGALSGCGGDVTSYRVPESVMALGNGFSCVRVAGDLARCWGSNALGQLGDGTTTSRSEPTPVVDLTHVAQLAAAQQHACARRSDD